MKKILIGLIIGLSISFGVIVYSASNTQMISYFFSQEDQAPDVQLINLINSAKSTVDIAIYSLTKPNIVDSILKAKKRGVSVRIITDKIQSAGKSQSVALDTLRLLKIPVKVDSHAGLMHMKVTIVDKTVCTTGSFNYSKAAVENNDEVFVIMKDGKIAQDWSREFEKMWNDGKRFENY